MKVNGVEIYCYNFEEAPSWHPVVVRVNTDEGISGLGEVGLAYGTGHSAAVGMVKDMATGFLIGIDPFESEKLWEQLFRETFWALGGGPVVFGGMSAIDTALWDIKGKALGVPVHKLLGGKTNDALRTYASQIQFGWGDQPQVLTEPTEYAEAALEAVSKGYDCVKVDPVMFNAEGQRNAVNLRTLLTPEQVGLFRDRIAAIREAVGPEVDIILEVHSYLSADTAIQLGRAWEPFNCYFYEEPVHYLNAALQKEVADGVKIPLAAGERIYTRWGYREYFESHSLSVIQPDLGLVGGISEGKKICDYAYVHDVGVQVHVCGSPVATAAALQLEAVIPNFVIHEHHTNALKAHNRSICLQDYQPVDGRFHVPDEPGLGIALDPKTLGRAEVVEIS